MALAAIVVIAIVFVELRRPGDPAVLPPEEEETLASTSLDRVPIDLSTHAAGGNSDPAALPAALGGAEPALDLDRTTPNRWAGNSAIWRFGPVPPGMVFIPGGETAIGTPLEELNELLEQHPALQKNASGLLAETPRHAAHVEGFYGCRSVLT